MPRFYSFGHGSGSGGGGSSHITVKNEGSTLSTTVTTLDFIGNGVTASGSGTSIAIYVPGFGADLLANRPAASSPATVNMIFYASDNKLLYYSDGATWTTMVIGIASGGTGQTTANGAYNALSPMTTLGDIEYEDATPKAVRLAGNTTTTRKFLRQVGNGSISAAPAWDTLLAADIPALAYLNALNPTAVKTSNYSAAANDFVPCDVTSAGFTITLPTAPADKTLIAAKIINGGGAGNNVSIATGGSDVINRAGGATSASLYLQGHSFIFQYLASSAIWYVLATDIPRSIAVVSKTANYSIATVDEFIVCDATSAAFTVTLPTAVGVRGKVYRIKKIDSSANAVNIATTSAQTIDGASSLAIITQYNDLVLVSDNANWQIL